MKYGNLTIAISDHLPSFLIVPKDKQNHMPKRQNLYTQDGHWFWYLDMFWNLHGS